MRRSSVIALLHRFVDTHENVWCDAREGVDAARSSNGEARHNQFIKSLKDREAIRRIGNYLAQFEETPTRLLDADNVRIAGRDLYDQRRLHAASGAHWTIADG